jgi:hypothetical protein
MPGNISMAAESSHESCLAVHGDHMVFWKLLTTWHANSFLDASLISRIYVLIFLVRNICSDLTQLSRGHNSQVNNYVTQYVFGANEFWATNIVPCRHVCNSRLLQVYPLPFSEYFVLSSEYFVLSVSIILCIKMPAHDGIQSLIAAFVPHQDTCVFSGTTSPTSWMIFDLYFCCIYLLSEACVLLYLIKQSHNHTQFVFCMLKQAWYF